MRTKLSITILAALLAVGCASMSNRMWTGECKLADETTGFCGVEFDTWAQCNAARKDHDRDAPFPGHCN